MEDTYITILTKNNSTAINHEPKTNDFELHLQIMHRGVSSKKF